MRIWRIIAGMRDLVTRQTKMLGIAAATGCAMLLAIVTFQGWMRHGTDIFLAAVQSGVAWCF
ncbi:hypothetical protein A6U92_02125 [Agrobacterium rubi]|nr:hypothetical protein A6U92_02125 [Agrobacterium rubi]